MTSSTPADLDRAQAAQWTARARALLVAGLIGAHIVGLACIGIFSIVAGRAGMASAALGFAVVVLFSTAGQLVMVRLASSHPRTMMVGAMASYLLRCSLLILTIGIVWNTPGLMDRLHGLALVISTAATTVGWLVAEIVRFSRMRILAFEVDLPSERQHSSDAGTSDTSDRAVERRTEGGAAWA